jgi:hypothetical protein
MQELFDTKMKETPKMGRPPLPKDKARYGQVAVRLNSDEAEELSRLAANSDKSQPEVVRQQIFDPVIWVDTPLRKDQLHGKKILFQFAMGDSSYKGVGELVCRERDDGKKCVVIIAFIVLGPELGKSLNIRLSQKAVDAIKEKPGENPPFELVALLRDQARPLQPGGAPPSP